MILTAHLPVKRWSAAVRRFTGCTPAGLGLAVGLATASAILVNRYQPTPAWKHVMWEGGVLEWLTAASFIAAGVLYLWLALASREERPGRAWLALFGVGSLILAGEELNWGQGMLLLNLDDPEFAARYNLQGGNLHNVFHAPVPVLAFLGLAGGLRMAAPWSLRLVPLPVGFLNAVIVAAMSIPFMDLGGDRFLLLDEVLEWSNATLIFALALHYRYGWCFVVREGAYGSSPPD